jgi:fructokinase
VELAKDGGALISFDPNLRASLWKDLDEAREQMLWGCSVCDVLKVAEEELEFLTGEAELNAGATALRAKFPNVQLLLVTRGRDGSIAFHGAERLEQAAFLQPDTVDTTGAGDTFCACCLHFVLQYGLDGLKGERLSEMLRFAAAAAALITTKKGAIRSMPSVEEVQQLLDKDT